MQHIVRMLMLVLCLQTASHMKAAWEEYILPASGIAAATSVVSWGIYQYRVWREHRNVEDIYTQTRDTIAHLQEKYQPLMATWHQRSHIPHADFVRHILSTLQPFEDGIAELEAMVTTLDTLLHRSASVASMDAYPALTADLNQVITDGCQIQETLQHILAYCTRHYGQFMLYDTLYVSRHLVPYYQLILSYHQQYPDPDRRQYVDTALMSQYASARLNWPRLYAVDQMHQHIKALERGQALLHQETDTQSQAPEQQLNRDLLQAADYMIYNLKDIHMYLTTLPGYHAERDGHYQEQREKEYEERIQAQYEQKVQAERDRARAEEQRTEEARRTNKLREKALQWGIEYIPEIRNDLKRLADACRNNSISRHEVQRELDEIVRRLPEPRSNVIAGIQWLLECE